MSSVHFYPSIILKFFVKMFHSHETYSNYSYTTLRVAAKAIDMKIPPAPAQSLILFIKGNRFFFFLNLMIFDVFERKFALILLYISSSLTHELNMRTLLFKGAILWTSFLMPF